VPYSFFLEGGRCLYVPLVFCKALSITLHFLSFHCLLPSTSMYINCTKEGGRVQVKHHKTCFYFRNEPCFPFYVMGGPPIPNIFRCWAHPMTICEIFTLQKLRLHLRLGGGWEGGVLLFFFFPHLFFSCCLICSQWRLLLIPYSSRLGSSFIHISSERGARGKHDKICFYFVGGKHIYAFMLGLSFLLETFIMDHFLFLND